MSPFAKPWSVITFSNNGEGEPSLTHAEPSDRFVQAVEPASVVDQVTKEIRRSILSGSLKPGQQFSLREI